MRKLALEGHCERHPALRRSLDEGLQVVLRSQKIALVIRKFAEYELAIAVAAGNLCQLFVELDEVPDLLPSSQSDQSELSSIEWPVGGTPTHGT